MSQPQTVTYFCPTDSCGDALVERPRDTGLEYFGPGIDDDQLSISLRTAEQIPDIVKTEVKHEPGTFYAISEKCVDGFDAEKLASAADAGNYYEISENEIDTQPNSSEVRTETGCQYFGTGPCEEVIGTIPDEWTLMQMKAAEESGEFQSVKYFCSQSNERILPERQRSTGLSYFGGIDYRSVRYFCPGPCEHMPPEEERDTGLGMFIGSVYDEGEYRVNPIPEFGNLSDIRVISGCHYYGGDRCPEHVGVTKPYEGPQFVRYFCPGSCEELLPEQPRDTGLWHFGKPPGAITSADSVAEPEDEDVADVYQAAKYYCTPSCENVAFEVPRETGTKFFIPTRDSTPAPVRDDVVQPLGYFCAVPTYKVPVERPRETGMREFGPPDETLLGYDYNLSDLRTETGCIYYSGEPCIDVVTADRTVKPTKPEKYFCPGVCDHMPPETPRETGMTYFGPGSTSPSTSVAESLAVEPDAFDGYVFNLSDVRAKSGIRFFSGVAVHEGYPPVRYFCPGSCESLAPEPVRRTGSDYFGPEAIARLGPDSSLIGFTANLDDTRTETGCQYFGAGPCTEVIGWDRIPRCLTWTRHQVAGWIESLGFTLYRDCFINNYVNGRRLIFIDASALPKLGITNVEHIKTIARAIRNLIQVELIPWNRSIRLPPREQLDGSTTQWVSADVALASIQDATGLLGMFLERKAFTGVEADRLTIDQLAEDWEYLKFQPPLCNHGLLLPRH